MKKTRNERTKTFVIDCILRVVFLVSSAGFTLNHFIMYNQESIVKTLSVSVHFTDCVSIWSDVCTLHQIFAKTLGYFDIKD